MFSKINNKKERKCEKHEELLERLPLNMVNNSEGGIVISI